MSDDKPKSAVVPLVVAFALSIGIGAGGAFGLDMLQAAPATGQAEDAPSVDALPRALTALPALLTNLAPPGNTWVRLEASLLSGEAVADDVVADIQRDMLAYLRTVHLSQVEGPSGYLDFRDALEERARLHSGDPDMRLLVRTLLFE